jgi:hypothetical protein
MQRLSSFATRRRSLAVGLLMAALALLIVLGAPADSEALGCGYGWIVYNNSSMSQVIGARFWYPETCGCEFVSWGSFTGYRVSTSFACF